jgi:hypothetical protein
VRSGAFCGAAATGRSAAVAAGSVFFFSWGSQRNGNFDVFGDASPLVCTTRREADDDDADDGGTTGVDGFLDEVIPGAATG